MLEPSIKGILIASLNVLFGVMLIVLKDDGVVVRQHLRLKVRRLLVRTNDNILTGCKKGLRQLDIF